MNGKRAKELRRAAAALAGGQENCDAGTIRRLEKRVKYHYRVAKQTGKVAELLRKRNRT